MNLFSLTAAVSATYFFMIIYQRITTSKLDKQNILALLVLTSLLWWCACDSFFYVAKTSESAWFWHKLGAPGWCGFIALTSRYFLAMSGVDERFPPLLKIAFWIPPLLLVVHFLLPGPTAFADELILSTSGMGWTYIQHYNTVWPFLFLAYLILYMGGALFYLYLWQKKVKSRNIRMLAKGFVLLDGIVVVLGFISIFVIPYFSHFLPPAGCVPVLIFGLWYWGWLRDYDFLYVELALNPGHVFENCIAAMLVTDAEYRILYANQEAVKLLGEACHGEELYTDFLIPESRRKVEEFITSGKEKESPLSLKLKNGIPVLCSFSLTRARRKNFKVCVVCMYEISELQKAQEKLDYLAHYDELTGLYNRRRLGELLEQWKNRFEETGEDFELFFLDLTGFKGVNDTFGHRAGDRALIAAGGAMRAVILPGDVLARFAGDEFVVLHRPEGGEDMEEILRKAVQEIDCSDFAPGFIMNADIGRCLFSEAEDLNELYRLADIRMYEKKRGGRRDE